MKSDCGGEFADSFYPGRERERREMIDSWTLDAPPVEGRVDALLLPHAGWIYSGECAMRAIRAASGRRPRTLIHVGPSHRRDFEGAVILDAENVAFGDGTLPLARKLGDELCSRLPQLRWESPFAEHSLEVQWPLLAEQWPEVELLPVVLGRNSVASLRELGSVLGEIVDGEETLAVVSTDLSHYHPERLDARFEHLLVSGDAERLAEALAHRQTEACGWAPVLASLEMARRRGDRYRVVDRRDSSWTSGDRGEVVGYLSALLVEAGEAVA